MNIAEQINEVIRRVEISRNGQAVAVERHFDTTAPDLWDACTNPERLASWFEPVEGDLQQGGRYRLMDSGTVGRIELCEPPLRLHVTWEYDGDASRVELQISPAGDDRARLELSHGGPQDAHWRKYGPAAGGVGWDSSLLALSLHLADDHRAAPAAMAAWSNSDDGRGFVTESVKLWEQSHVEAGADQALAAQTAQRARDAYTDTSW